MRAPRELQKLTDGTGNVSKTAFLHFELQSCGSNFPIVPNNAQVVVQTAFDIKPNQSDGSIIGQVIPNDLILCDNTPAHSGKTLGRFPTKTAGWKAAQVFRVEPPQPQQTGEKIKTLVERYRLDKDAQAGDDATRL
jgi:hypothetical protein